MDPNQKEGEMLSEEINTANGKFCVDCKTTKTPLWRSGPAGPKSLCNACGIRHRKKRASIVGLKKDQDKKKRDYKETSSKKKRDSVGSSKVGKFSEDLRKRLMAFGKEVVLLQRQRSPVRRQRNNNSGIHRELGEVEQAAVLLMALSCGSVFA